MSTIVPKPTTFSNLSPANESFQTKAPMFMMPDTEAQWKKEDTPGDNMCGSAPSWKKPVYIEQDDDAMCGSESWKRPMYKEQDDDGMCY